MLEIKQIYSQFENPSCTRLADIDGYNVTVSDELCDRWIYDYDYGYKSMNTEVGVLQQSSVLRTSPTPEPSSGGCCR